MVVLTRTYPTTTRNYDASRSFVGTVRGTAFDPVAAEGGSAAVETVGEVKDAGISHFVSEEAPSLSANGSSTLW
jgi:hypothetical protein